VALPLRRVLPLCLVALTSAVPLAAQEVLVLEPDSPRWTVAGRAKVDEFLGRRCLMLDGATVSISDFTMQDGVIDLDVATAAPRGFFGVEFRGDSLNSEFVYLRQHKSGAPDAMQYTPVLNTGLNWQLFSGPGFTGRVNIPQNIFTSGWSWPARARTCMSATPPPRPSSCPTSRPVSGTEGSA
jgi:hypothetical protein